MPNLVKCQRNIRRTLYLLSNNAYITNEIYAVFDKRYKVRGMFLWHLTRFGIFKSKQKEYIVNRINNDLHNISRWTYLWRTRFDIDHSKPALEIIFSRKIKVSAHLQFLFNNNPAHQTSTQKYIGIFLDFSCETFRNIFRTCSIKLMKP